MHEKPLIEIRCYRLHAGKAQMFDQLMREQSLPLLHSSGCEVVYAGASLDHPEHYVLIRAYHDLAEREQSQQAFYSSAAWREGPRAAILDCIDSSVDFLTQRSLLSQLFTKESNEQGL